MQITLPSKFEPVKPFVIQDFQEVTIKLFAINFHSCNIDEKILKEKQIIPSDWQLKPRKLIKPNLTELAFENNFKIRFEQGKIHFHIKISNQKLPICEVINKFVDSFPQFIYSKLEIIPLRLISLPGTPNIAQNFIVNNLIIKGEWLNFQNVRPKIEVQFYYKLQDNYLLLKITDIKFKTSSNVIKPALIFQGIFYDKLNWKSKKLRLQKIKFVLNNYNNYLEKFNNIINALFHD